MLSTLRDSQKQETLDIIRGTNVCGIDDEKLGSAKDAVVRCGFG
jgi:hypothetical protein